MAKERTFFIIPGFKQKPSNMAFQWLRALLESKGFIVVGVTIDWDRRTMDEYSADFVAIYEKHKTSSNYVLGFSYGAVIAFLTANALKPKKIFLCSLSPDFKEDTSAMTPWIQRYIGKKRIAHSLRTSGRRIARGLQVPSVVFCGEKEGDRYPQLMIRCAETARLAKQSKLVIVEKAPHDIAFPSYKVALTKELQDL